MKNIEVMQNNIRSLYGDILKGIAIILVIVGHTYKGAVCQAVYMFHMPIFFFLAGYFFNFDKYKVNFLAFLTNTYNRIIIPVLFTFLLFYSVKGEKYLKMLFYGSGKHIPEWGIIAIGFSMWFLFCLICVRFLLWSFLKITKKINCPIWLNLILSSGLLFLGVFIGQKIKLPWSFDIALVALFIAYIGYELKQINFFSKIKYSWFVIPIALILSYFDYKYLGLSMNERYYSAYPLISVSVAVVITMALMFVSKFIEKVAVVNKFLAYLGINSLIIMLFHSLAHCSAGAGICVIWRLFVCIIIIEVLAFIPRLAKIYNAKSVLDVFNIKNPIKIYLQTKLNIKD